MNPTTPARLLCLLTLLVGLSAPALRADAMSIPAGATVDQVLDALHARGEGLKTLSADVAMTTTSLALGDAFTRAGTVRLLDSGADTKLHITFETKQENGRRVAEKIEYLLSGETLIDRTYDRKIEVRRRLHRGDRKAGEKPDLLNLDGPFPLPIGQKREDVLRRFEVKKIDPADADPAGTVHLLLTPRPQTPLAREFQTLDVWVNRADALPRRVETLDSAGNTVKTTDLTDVKINAPLPPDAFALPPIDEKAWQVTVQPADAPADAPAASPGAAPGAAPAS